MSVVFLNNVRLSFPHLKAPHSSGAGMKESYSADFILDPQHAGYVEFMKAVGALAAEKWGQYAGQVLNLVQNDRKLRAFGTGAEKVNKKTFEPYDGYKDNLYISAKKDEMPQMIKPDGSGSQNTMEAADLAGKLYGGCYVNAVVKPWLQDNAHGRAVRCELVAVQFAADGDAFGEAEPDVSSMFGQVAAPAGPTPSATNPAGFTQQPVQPPNPPSFEQGPPIVPGMPDFLK